MSAPVWTAVDDQPKVPARTPAPTGTIYVCAACGKTNTDIMNWGKGWDESCAQHAVLCHQPATTGSLT